MRTLTDAFRGISIKHGSYFLWILHCVKIPFCVQKFFWYFFLIFFLFFLIIFWIFWFCAFFFKFLFNFFFFFWIYLKFCNVFFFNFWINTFFWIFSHFSDFSDFFFFVPKLGFKHNVQNDDNYIALCTGNLRNSVDCNHEGLKVPWESPWWKSAWTWSSLALSLLLIACASFHSVNCF